MTMLPLDHAVQEVRDVVELALQRAVEGDTPVLRGEAAIEAIARALAARWEAQILAGLARARRP